LVNITPSNPNKAISSSIFKVPLTKTISIVDPSPSYLLHSNTAALNLVLSLSYFLI